MAVNAYLPMREVHGCFLWPKMSCIATLHQVGCPLLMLFGLRWSEPIPIFIPVLAAAASGVAAVATALGVMTMRTWWITVRGENEIYCIKMWSPYLYIWTALAGTILCLTAAALIINAGVIWVAYMFAAFLLLMATGTLVTLRPTVSSWRAIRELTTEARLKEDAIAS